MAFDKNYLGRVNTSANNQALNVWSYNATASGTNETAATVAASAYFNSFQQVLTSGSEVGPLVVGDAIYIHGNDTSAIYVVSSITTNVTVASLSGESARVVYSGKESDGGGSATVAITVTGALSTDLVFAQVEASTNAVEVQKVTPTTNTVTVLLSGDPGASTVVTYQVLRATA